MNRGIFDFENILVGQLLHSPVSNQISIEFADCFAGFHIQIDIVAALNSAFSGHFTFKSSRSTEDLLQQINGAFAGE